MTKSALWSHLLKKYLIENFIFCTMKNTLPGKSKILKISKNNHSSWNFFQDLLIVFCKLFYLQYHVSSDQWNKKHFISNIALEIPETILHEHNFYYNSCKFSKQFAFTPLRPFIKSKNRNQTSSKLMVW